MIRSLYRSLRRRFFRYFARYFGGLIKKDPNLVLLGAMDGRYYGDNSRHVYEWILDNQSELSPVWITGNITIYNELKNENRPVAFSSSIKGFLLLFRAKVATYTNSLFDISAYPALVPSSLQLILLPHGSAAKGYRYSRKNRLSEREHKARQKESSHVAYLISTSEFVNEIEKKAYRLGQEKYVITGYPRNDCLFKISDGDKAKWQRFLDGRNPRFTVLYGPSWRHERRPPTQFFPFEDFDIDRLLSFAEKTKTLILLRPHMCELDEPETMELLHTLVSQSEMIMIASHDTFPDAHLLMRFADALISDYSGLIHDYLLLDRPLVLVPYDYDDYAQQNGFTYDYFENLPGKSVGTFNELIDHLEELSKGFDPYQNKRHALCNKIHLYKDDHSCQRVAALIEQLLESID